MFERLRFAIWRLAERHKSSEEDKKELDKIYNERYEKEFEEWKARRLEEILKNF